MNGPTRAPLSLSTTRRTYVRWTNSPSTSIGERSPCGALLQLVAAMRFSLQSVAGSLRSAAFGWRGGNNVTPALEDCVANSYGRTPAGGQFGWGGTPLKRYRGGPKVGSSGSEKDAPSKNRTETCLADIEFMSTCRPCRQVYHDRD